MVRTAKKPEIVKDRKATYIRKETTTCPVCDKPFKREELFQGRVNAAGLTDELHRLYTPMAAFGEVIPLVYPITVCPNCYFAAFPQDFEKIADKVRVPLNDAISARIDSVTELFASGLDFSSPRRLPEGIASYLLAMQCYEAFPDNASPVIKQAICALRAAWLFIDLDKKLPAQNYDYISRLLYDKATWLYGRALDYDQRGKQALQVMKFLGPDTDTNFGYDGVLFLCATLELKYGQKKDEEARRQRLDSLLCTIAKMFGLGKKTKNKPGPLLDKARDLYDTLKKEVGRENDVDE